MNCLKLTFLLLLTTHLNVREGLGVFLDRAAFNTFIYDTCKTRYPNLPINFRPIFCSFLNVQPPSTTQVPTTTMATISTTKRPPIYVCKADPAGKYPCTVGEMCPNKYDPKEDKENPPSQMTCPALVSPATVSFCEAGLYKCIYNNKTETNYCPGALAPFSLCIPLP